MSSDHTPEPWYATEWISERDGEHHFGVGTDYPPGRPGDGSRSIAFMTGGVLTQNGRPEPQRSNIIGANRANSRRIAAAINACAGIPTEALRRGVVADLLEACKAANERLSMYESTENVISDVSLSLREAIAKATGKEVTT